MNPFSQSPIYYQTYLLQLENYELKRFFHAVVRNPWARHPLRTSIIWTPKLISVSFLAIVLSCSVIAAALVPFGFFGALAVFVILFALPALPLSLAVLLLLPPDIAIRHFLIVRACRKLKRFPNLKIIGITGSYGKTTMKRIITTLLLEQFSVLSTPGNINTPIGIARFILKKLDAKTQILVVEMGAYRKGDIRALCELTPPHIAVLTGITEAHLERFGSLQAIVEGKFELVTHASPDATVVLNADDEHVTRTYRQFIGNHPVLWYAAHMDERARYAVTDKGFSKENGGLAFALERDGKSVYKVQTPLLGEYAAGTVAGAILAAEAAGESREHIARGLSLIRPVEHRLEPHPTSGGVLVIDDSYNGNPAGVREAIKVLSRFTDRRKIYLTPGLVETGAETEHIHRTIAHELAAAADLVLLVRTSASAYIEDELRLLGFPKEAVRVFPSAPEAHAALPDILKRGDVILFQNDWPDNYA